VLRKGTSQHADYYANQGEDSPTPALKSSHSTERDKSLPQHMEALRADLRVRFSGLPRLEEGL